jgi:hypothetical protein
MNRKKKINATLKSRLKRANAKMHTSNKPKYVSKAERAKLEAEAISTESANIDVMDTQSDNETDDTAVSE